MNSVEKVLARFDAEWRTGRYDPVTVKQEDAMLKYEGFRIPLRAWPKYESLELILIICTQLKPDSAYRSYPCGFNENRNKFWGYLKAQRLDGETEFFEFSNFDKIPLNGENLEAWIREMETKYAPNLAGFYDCE